MFRFESIKIPIRTRIGRNLSSKQSSISEILENPEQIYKLKVNPSENVASYVRFNRDIEKIKIDNFAILYSKLNNPCKSDYELEEIRLRIALICAEFEYICSQNFRVPSKMSVDHMRSMLKMVSPEVRQKFFNRIYFKDVSKTKIKLKKIIEKSEKIKTNDFESGCFDLESQLQYGLWKNSIFGRMNNTDRQRIQTGLNSIQWGKVLAFDWSFPIKFVEQIVDHQCTPLSHVPIHDHFYHKFCWKIFVLCNANLKKESMIDPQSTIIHYNLDSKHILRHRLDQFFQTSSIDQMFYDPRPHSYLDDYPSEQICYINPYADKTLTMDEINRSKVFVFNPYSELFGLRPTTLKHMLMLKNESETKKNVKFYRLPIHDMVIGHHIALLHYLNCFRAVLSGIGWNEALNLYMPKKYHRK